MRLNDQSGKPVDILLGDVEAGKELGQQVIRVSDGKTLGHLPARATGRGARMMIWGDLMTFGAFADAGKFSNTVFRLAFTGPETVGATVVHEFESPIIRGGHFLTGMEGMVLGLLPRDRAGRAFFRLADGHAGGAITVELNEDLGAVVAGKYLIGRANDPGRSGTDRKRMAKYVVIDAGDPSNPKVVSDNNLLGYDAPTADIILQTYFKELDPFQFMGCYAGVAGYFHEMGGPVPHGDKLLIQSGAYLYCIADDLQGRLEDDPRTVERIRAASAGSALSEWIASEVPQYRYESLRRYLALAAAGPAPDLAGVADRLRTLALNDPYAAIRQDALRVLGLEAGEPGTRLIEDQLLAPKKWHGPDWDGNTWKWGPIFSAMGDDGVPAILAMLGEGSKPELRRRVADCMVWMPDGTPALREGLLTLAKTSDASRDLVVHALAGRHDSAGWRLDPSIRAFMEANKTNNRRAGEYLGWHPLPTTETRK
jgi:hypothetical protein